MLTEQEIPIPNEKCLNSKLNVFALAYNPLHYSKVIPASEIGSSINHQSFVQFTHCPISGSCPYLGNECHSLPNSNIKIFTTKGKMQSICPCLFNPLPQEYVTIYKFYSNILLNPNATVFVPIFYTCPGENLNNVPDPASILKNTLNVLDPSAMIFSPRIKTYNSFAHNPLWS